MTRIFNGFFETAKNICEHAEHQGKDALLINIHFCISAIAANTNDHNDGCEHKEKSFNPQSQILASLGIVDERLALA